MMSAARPAEKVANRVRPLRARRAGFSLVELLVVITVVAILAGLLLPALSRAAAKAKGVDCANRLRQLTLAWHLYADDNSDRLVYNLGGDLARRTVAPRNAVNWVNNVMSWELDPDNTNLQFLETAQLTPYTGRFASLYRCPADQVVSALQRKAGWTHRVRSFSMNAMVGDAGVLSQGGTNINNPEYRQFFKLAEIPHPAEIFVLLDEHPDSIDDGYFVNNADQAEWVDLPAAYHNGAGNLSFADGHAEPHMWHDPATTPPPQPDAANLPFPVPPGEASDFGWLMAHTSVER